MPPTPLPDADNDNGLLTPAPAPVDTDIGVGVSEPVRAYISGVPDAPTNTGDVRCPVSPDPVRDDVESDNSLDRLSTSAFFSASFY
jgi:hypothetical protein